MIVNLATIEISILNSAEFNMQVSIAPQDMTPLNNCLCRHIGGGAVVFSWENNNANIDYFDIEASLSLDGPYSLGIGGNIPSDRTSIVLHNLPLTKTLYFRIKAVDKLGVSSEYHQFRAAVGNKPKVRTIVSSILNSRVVSAAIFSAHVSADRLIGLTPAQDLVLR